MGERSVLCRNKHALEPRGAEDPVPSNSRKTTTMLTGLSEPLCTLVRRQYKIARESGELIYSETSETVVIRTEAGIPARRSPNTSHPLTHPSSSSATAPLC